jgi:HK97 gp10 family phage protein
MKDNFFKDVTAFQKALQKKTEDAEKNAEKFVQVSCQEIERTAKTIMRDSPVNFAVSYGKKKHHPSIEGEPPSPNTGTLMRSITHSLNTENGKVVGYVGSIIMTPEYPKFLEFGTSKMKPRPWLSTALIKCQDFISKASKEILKK